MNAELDVLRDAIRARDAGGSQVAVNNAARVIADRIDNERAANATLSNLIGDLCPWVRA